MDATQPIQGMSNAALANIDPAVRISGVVICLNEAGKIGDCLLSMRGIVDELVVVDSGSTDGTREVAESHGARVIQRAFDTFSAQKNAGIAQARYPWILSLDADERLSGPLRDSLSEWRNRPGAHPAAAMGMNRLNHLGSQAIRHGSWWPDVKIRLFHRSVAQWGPGNPHEELLLQPGTVVGRLQGPLLHLTAANAEVLRRKGERYALLWSEGRGRQGGGVPVWKPALRAAFRWLRDYLLRGGFLDGRAGWDIARIDAGYTYRKYWLARQQNRLK